MIKNHPNDELLSSYSAGSLSLGQALCVSAHMEFCNDCCQKLQRLNQLGGELMLQLDPADVSDSLKSSVLDRLDDALADIEEESKRPSSARNDSVPRCLRQFVPSDYQNMPWHRVAKSIHNLELFQDDESAKVEMLKIKPGGSATTHSHLGDEYTVVLEGSFSDEDGVYHQGDFLVRDSRHTHTPVATLDRDCICLAVSEAPLQFTGLFKQLLNPLLRRGYS